MRSTRGALCFLAVLGSAAAVAAPPASDTNVQRGAYLVRIMGCNDCHTPMKMGPKGPESDMTRMLTGHPADLKLPPPPDLGKGPWVWTGSGSMTAFAGPWGVSYAINLTPDPETGIGKWTEKMFIDAMRTGRHLGKGRPILPPMPWSGIREATDRDLKAIFAYLRSLPPVKNAIPEPVEPPKAGP
ncbi:MAG TPA: diheme cytochrome c-553 [Thermoanaerobaculia bacterium]|nr:diheme cytochrome c-553 [Thermoanaerobaculia bacterium]